MNKCIKLVGAIFTGILALLFFCALRTAYLSMTKPAPLPVCQRNESEGYIDSTQAWERLKGALRIPTVSVKPHDYDRTALKKMVEFIRKNYPKVFTSPIVRPDVINEYSLLLEVSGSNKSLTPYALTGHLDVVPVLQDEWEWEGFGGEEAEEGEVMYGRGAVDNKGPVMAQLEALNFLLSRGIRPQRGFYLAYGHDEEVGGEDGAAKIAEELRKRGVNKLLFILDEGLPITRGLLKGLNKDLAGIGVTEKGSLYLNLTIHAEGGHSSAPPVESSIGILSKAISRLEENPHKLIFDHITRSLIHQLSFDMSFPLNIICSNLWLFEPIVTRVLARGTTKGLVRTTTAVTMIGGGIKHNVIPPSAWAVVNHRIHPSQTIAEVVARDKAVMNDERVRVEIMRGYEAHPTSPHDNIEFDTISESIKQAYPDSTTAPITMIANTDMGHYLKFTDKIYRFNPTLMAGKDVYRIHGRDERIHRKSFEASMNLYYHLMLNVDLMNLDTGGARHTEL
uniref:Probable carboxypeptidase PM20D1 n=1 Tax=Phallusia mammillata TaxID=59560 RepID=A0A6F9DND6_9ASCI|nr:probable carboxypeptidase PM20D1 [Phallusia mammillata]